MRNRKKRLAAVLAIAIALGDCSGMTALAEENVTAAEHSVSENTTISDEISDEEDSAPKTEDLETETFSPGEEPSENEQDPLSSNLSDEDAQIEESRKEEVLPALHIGYISEGRTLPSADDDAFSYDLPVVFDTEDNLILFSSYAIDAIPQTVENGTLEWSILRGEKGLDTGSTTLFDEEDDWDGFETVSSSPYFTIEEITDTESAYYQMMALSLKNVSADSADGETHKKEETDGDFDYYIRAAYYPAAGSEKAETFYTAATIPFVPNENRSADPDPISEDISDEEESLTDSAGEKTSVSENSADAAEPSISENSTDDESLSENSLAKDDEPDADKSGIQDTSDEADAETLSTISENSFISDGSMSAQAGEQPPLEEVWNGGMILYKGSGADDADQVKEKETIQMTSGSTQPLTVKADAETAVTFTPADILWESGDETVAAVEKGENGTAVVTSIREGYTKITASYRGKTASVTVEVLPDAGVDKIVDLTPPESASPALRIIGFQKESDDLVYTGQKVTQDLRVYHGTTLLKEKTDYTLSYKNNVNAAEWNTVKAPSVTINLKGQYQGSRTLYYTIRPLDINNIDIYDLDTDTDGNAIKKSPGYEQAVNYSKTLTIPAPALTFGKKKLAAKKDFVCDYTPLTEQLDGRDYKKGDAYEPGRVYYYTVNGTGNFTGSFSMQLVVLKDKKLNFSAASVKLDQKKYAYQGRPLSKSDVHITEVKISGQPLTENLYDYEVFASDIEGAYVMVSPSEVGTSAGYRGCKKVTLKLAGDRQIDNAVPSADWKESLPFSQKTVDRDGGIFQNGSALLVFGEGNSAERLTEGTDYTIKYGSAKKAGKVTATFKGMGRYKGSLRLTYTVTPNADIKIYPGENVKNNNGTYEVAYQKGGAAPELILKDQDYTVLKNKTDYTIKYTDNKAPGTMTCKITGKGNYKGYEKTLALTVTKADLGNCTITVPDKPYSDKPNKWQTSVTIKDTNGKKLTAGTDYDKTFIYSHKQEQSPQPNTEVTVTVTGLGFYEGSSVSGTYRIFEKNISTLKVVIDPQEYTGEEIKLTAKDIHVYASSADAKKKQNEIKKESCYEIIETEYKNNIKAGTAKVTLRGIGEYGGTKTYSFKIQKKKYLINRVKKITLDKNSLTFSLLAKDTEKTLTAVITPELADQVLANPTVIWSSSNNNIATVEPVKTTPEDTAQNALSSAVLIHAKKAGKVTITATAQDGNKKAKCTVTISIPALKQANKTIEGKAGDTFQLTFAGYENQEIDTNGILFKSDNENIVSVDEKGLVTMHKIGSSTIKVEIGGSANVQKCYVLVDGTVDDPENDPRVLVYHQEEGCKDDTPYINKLLRDWEWSGRGKYDYMYLPKGDYRINAAAGGNDVLGNYKFGGIVLTDNQTLVMEPGTRLIAIGNNKPNSQVINVFGRSNVTISGGQIIGERDSHKGSDGEWGHGIAIFGCTNVYIKDVEVSKCWGDGIYLGFYDGPNKSSSRITIKNCNVHDNRRNNLSVTDVSNVTIKSCKFNNARGTDPQYGIDIEPNRGRTCSNVLISDCTFKGNAGGTIQILGQLNAHVKGVTIENCTGDKKIVQWHGFGGSVSGVTEKNNKWG